MRGLSGQEFLGFPGPNGPSTQSPAEGPTILTNSIVATSLAIVK